MIGKRTCKICGESVLKSEMALFGSKRFKAHCKKCEENLKNTEKRVCNICGKEKALNSENYNRAGGFWFKSCRCCHPEQMTRARKLTDEEIKSRAEWVALALLPASSERYPKSVSIVVDEYIEHKKPDTFIECDYGSGVGIRGRA